MNDSWGRVDSLLGGFSDEGRREALSGVHHAPPRAGGEDQDPEILAPTEDPMPLYYARIVGDGPGEWGNRNRGSILTMSWRVVPVVKVDEPMNRRWVTQSSSHGEQTPADNGPGPPEPAGVSLAHGPHRIAAVKEGGTAGFSGPYMRITGNCIIPRTA